MQQKGLIISIDFELDWGYTNSKNPLNEFEAFEGLNKLIDIFKKHNVKTTWAIVGKLFENNKDKIDTTKEQFNWISKNLMNDELVEIGSHTYSHIFCEEVPLETFNKDISKMNKIADDNKLVFNSIVFPRNQYNDNNLKTLLNNKYTHYRSVLNKWYLKTNKFSEESIIKKYIIRFLELIPLKRDVIINNHKSLTSVSDSRFFRVFSSSFFGKIITPIYLKVLKIEMKNSLKRGKLYHIWFHPHNIIKKPNGYKQLEDFLTYYNEIINADKSMTCYKLSEINN